MLWAGRVLWVVFVLFIALGTLRGVLASTSVCFDLSIFELFFAPTVIRSSSQSSMPLRLEILCGC